MANGKKNFKMNPALSFISQESIDAVDGIKEKEKEEIIPAAESRKYEKNEAEPEIQDYKKESAVQTVTRAAMNLKEPKSKRVQLLTQPSLYMAIAEKASEMGISVNEAINEAMKRYVK